MEMWWLSVPFAVVLCLVLSWLSTGDEDVNIHETAIMRVSLRTSPPLHPFTSGGMSQDTIFFSYRQSSAREWSPCLYGQINYDEAQGTNDPTAIALGRPPH